MSSLAQSRSVKGVTREYPATYVAGPMTGYPNWNTPAFEKMAARLREAGLTVISPNELHEPDDARAREWYLRRDLEALVRHCGRVVFLPGWERSWGAQIEHRTAQDMGMELIYPHELEEFLAGLSDEGN